MKPDRIFILIAGLCGAAGVALSAVAAHAGGGNIGTAASCLLVHAPAFLVLSMLGGVGWILRLGRWGLLLGLAVFAGDLLARHYFGPRLFPMAAPTGGTIMILSWLTIGASALFGANKTTT